MANFPIMAMVSLLLLPLAFYSVTANLDKKAPKKSIVVEGMVYCQRCNCVGTSSLSKAEPIPLAKVNITCINHRKNQVIYCKEYTASEDGYFYAKLKGLSKDDHALTSCKVKLVSSPIESCDVPTNVNNGIYGSPLRFEHKRLVKKDCDTVYYSAGPLAFREAECNPEGPRY